MANKNSKRFEGEPGRQAGAGKPVPAASDIDTVPTQLDVPTVPQNAATPDAATTQDAQLDPEHQPTLPELDAIPPAQPPQEDDSTTLEKQSTLPEHTAVQTEQTTASASNTALESLAAFQRQEQGKATLPPVPDNAVIVVRDLTKTYVLGRGTEVQALRGVSLVVHPGEFVAIMGPSGSGKSTFMNTLGCLDRPTSGEYWLAGKLVSRMSTDELAGIRNQLIGFVFQGFNLLGRATALNNVALPMVYANIPRRERERRARKVLQLVGLGGRISHKPSELSGGQQQRVAIARSLVNGPALLLADEPTGNLDSHTSVEIMGVLQALNEQGLTIVLVTHDLNVAQYAKRQVSFLDGRVVRDEPVVNRRSAVEEWNELQREATERQAVVTPGTGATQVKEEKP